MYAAVSSNPRHHDLRDAIAPLKCIFWGSWFVVLDFNLKWDGYSLDIIHDGIGYLLLAVGIVGLRVAAAKLSHLSAQFSVYTMIALTAAIAYGIQSLGATFVPKPSMGFALLGNALGAFGLVATCLFLLGMRSFCVAGGLLRASFSWRSSLVIFLVMNVLPAAGFILYTTFGLLDGSIQPGVNYPVNLGDAALPLILLGIVAAAIPFIHILISISRTIREIRYG